MLKGQRRTLGACLVTLCLLLGTDVASAATVNQQTPTCQGDPATIVHVGFDTMVVGTDAADVIVVDGGWNHVYAGDGDDKICVTGHFNAVYGDDGHDIAIADGLYNNVYGGNGDDRIEANDASSFLQGGTGRNTCNGDPC